MEDWGGDVVGTEMGLIELAKYHGLGNDFLVLVDHEGWVALGPEDAVALCERSTGIGADGLIRMSPGAAIGSSPAGRASWRMELWNSDGSVAETSGNGLRCAALAVLDVAAEGDRTAVLVETATGTAEVRLVARAGRTAARLRAEMGVAEVAGEGPQLLGRRTRRVEVGNPHLVLYADPSLPAPPPVVAAGLARFEHGADGEAAGGLNVEAVSVLAGGDPGDFHHVALVVWERGAGVTRACGSGSVAAAAALRAAGLVGDVVVVHNPGGALFVELAGPAEAPQAALTGPAQLVARLVVEPQALVADAIAVAEPVPEEVGS